MTPAAASIRDAPGRDSPGCDSPGWDVLRARARAVTAGLPGVPEPGPGVCASCRGPARRGYVHCFHCGLHAETAPGLLADAKSL